MENLIERAALLRDSLPYVRRFAGKIFVVKLGGEAVDSPFFNQLIKDAVLLAEVGIKIVLVYGAGPQIDEKLRLAKLEGEKESGIRSTSFEVMQIVRKVSEEIYEKVSQAIISSSPDILFSRGHAVARQRSENSGFTGQPFSLEDFTPFDRCQIFILSPVANIFELAEDKDRFLNCNADEVAMTAACSLKAEKLIFFTNVDGIFVNNPSNPSGTELLPQIKVAQAQELIASKKVTGGMIPKLESAVEAFRNGVSACHIISYKKDGALLKEILTTSGLGTMIIP